MRKLIALAMLLFTCYTLYPADYEFDVERMGVDSLGVCHNENVVVAYGTGGIMLYSTDKGQSWKQKQIANDSVRISKIINIDEDFYGILFNGYLIKSTDNGNYWQTVKGEGNKGFIDMTSGDDALYVLTNQKTIQVFDYNLLYQNEVKLSDSIHSAQVIYFGGILYLSAIKGRIAALDINNDFAQAIIDISSYDSSASNFLVRDGFLYSKMGAKLYKTQNPQSAWTKVADTVKIYNVLNNTVYDIANRTNSHWGVSWPEFSKLDEKGRTKINTDSIQRFVTRLAFTQFEFLDDNTVIAVGTNKTIYLSTNSGLNWTLKSNLNVQIRNNISKRWLNRDLGYFSNCGQVFKTTDAGVTWLPQQSTDTLIRYINYFDKFYIDSTGKGFAWTTDDSRIYSDTAKNIIFVYTTDGGETFVNKWQSELSPRSGSLPSFTNIEPLKIDNNYILSTIPLGEYYQKRYKTVLFTMDENFNITNRYVADSIFLLKILKTPDNKLKALAWERRYPNKTGSFDSSGVWIVTSEDKGKSWARDFECKVYGSNILPIFVEGNELFAYSTESIKITPDSSVRNYYFYAIDLNKKSTKLIYSDSLVPLSEYLIFKYSDNLYLKNAYNEVLICSNYNDGEPVWKKADKFLNSTLENQGVFGNAWSDNECIYTTYSSQINSTNYFFTTLKLTPKYDTTAVTELPKVDFDYLWASPAYPNPADDHVKTKVYAYMDEEFNLNNINVYDVLGSKLSTEGKLSLMAMENKSATVTWDCSGMKTGVYFIQINIGSKSRTVPVIIAR